MTWHAPWAFLFFLPWLVCAWRMLRPGRSGGAMVFAPLSRLPQRTTWRQRLAGMAPILFLLGLASGILAAARPQTRMAQARRSTDAIAISMIVDVSGSMDALDLSERKGSEWEFRTRLDVVKAVFADFVQRRPDDLIGLITFGGYATTRSPLTLDHAALLHVLEGVEIPRGDDVIDQEELLTAIGDALALGCARLKEATHVTSRVAVLLSDGESNAGILSTTEATEIAKALGIRVYTIGVGSTGVAPFLGRDLFGRDVVRQVEVTMDEAELKQIAAATGGLYFLADDREGLERAMAEIDALERSEVDVVVFEDRREHFAPWLWSAVALLLLAVTLNLAVERRVA